MKKLVKQGISTMLAAAMCVSLAACASDNSNTAPDAGSSPASATATTETAAEHAAPDAGQDPITLRFAWWGGDARHEATLAAIELYQQRNPHVTIEAEYQGYDGYYEKMMTTLSSQTAPDIFQFHRDWLADVQGAKHYLADMSALPVDLSTLKEGLLEKSGTYKNEPIMFPVTVGAQVLYINTDFAETFGIDMEKQYTWTELAELGRQVHEQDPDAYLMTADIDVLNRLIVLAYLSQQTGTSIVDEETYELTFTEAQMTEALQNVLNLYESNTLEPFGEAAVFVGQMDQNNKWLNGKIGILMDNTGNGAKYTTALPDKIDVMPIPTQAGAVCSGVDFGGNMGISINDSSPNKEEAARFLDFMFNDPEAIEILQTTRGYCPTEKAEQVLSDKGLLNQIQRKGVEMGKVGSYSLNAISSNTELETIRKNVIQEVIYGDSTPEEGAREIVEQYEMILAELKSQE